MGDLEEYANGQANGLLNRNGQKPFVGSNPTSSANWEMKLKITNLKNYQKLCKKTAKKFNNKEKEILIWGLGLTGETGDIAGCIKKTFSHNNDQRKGIRENLGDIMWYISMICNYFHWNLDEILEENIEKLKKRYTTGRFTIRDAKRKGARIDWNEK